MKLHAMGIGYRHDENFRIFRPEGSGDNLLVIFRTPAFAVVGNVRVELPADSAVRGFSAEKPSKPFTQIIPILFSWCSVKSSDFSVHLHI